MRNEKCSKNGMSFLNATPTNESNYQTVLIRVQVLEAWMQNSWSLPPKLSRHSKVIQEKWF